MLSRFHLIPERNGQTDGRTDIRQICYINIARQCADAQEKKSLIFPTRSRLRKHSNKLASGIPKSGYNQCKKYSVNCPWDKPCTYLNGELSTNRRADYKFKYITNLCIKTKIVREKNTQ